MKKFSLQCLAIVFITFCLSWSANKLMDLWLLKVAFPETIALEDFHWEDFAFKLAPALPVEKKIVLVNIGQVNRGGIGKMIEIINENNPKVIGMRVLFNCQSGLRDPVNCPQLLDTAGNRILAEAIRKSPGVVMSTVLRYSKASAQNNLGIIDSIEYSDERFQKYAYSGFESLPHTSFQDIKESRSFFPQMKVAGKLENSFAVQITQLFDSAKAARFLKRHNEMETINFKGNVGNYKYQLGSIVVNKEKHFETVEYDSLMLKKFAPGLFKNNIVLLGFLGDNLDDPAFQDKFYTPLNPTFAGRSFPDMLGLVVHANIISTIVNEDYINQLSPFWENFLLTIIVLINAGLYIVLLKRNSIWYDSLCFIIPVTQIVIISWLRIELMTDYGFRFDLQNVIYLIAFVGFATNLYFGPIQSLWHKMIERSDNS